MTTASPSDADLPLAALLDAGFDFVCTRRPSELVDLERVLAALDRATTPARIPSLLARFATPGRTRLLAWVHAREHLLAAWLPDGARERLARLLGEPLVVPAALIDELVASPRVREQLRATLEASLSQMLARTPLGWGAKAGKSFLGALGGGVEERMRELLDLGVGLALRQLAERLKHPDTARALGRRRRAGFLSLLRRREREVAAFIEHALPWQNVCELAPEIAAHGFLRDELRALIASELAHTLTELDRQTVGELLDELGCRDVARAASRERLLPLARDFLATPAGAPVAAALKSAT